jgi:hypothetical protein
LPVPNAIIFESNGGYQDDQGRQKKAFWKGVVYTRGPGGNVEASQSELDALINRLAEERVRSLVAKIERIAALPADAELTVRSPAAPDQGYALVTKDSGIPVRIVDEGHREALPVREVLSAAVPFSSMHAELVAQTRHWRQSDRAHRVPNLTLTLISPPCLVKHR